MVVPYAGGTGVFPLRCDLGSAATSLPYVLVKYVPDNPTTPNPYNLWQYNVYSVAATAGDYQFQDWPSAPIPRIPTRKRRAP